MVIAEDIRPIVFETPNANIHLHTNSHKLIMLWNFHNIFDGLPVKEKPSINSINFVDLQEKHHAFRCAYSQEPIHQALFIFVLPLFDDLGVLTIDLNVKLGRDALAKCDRSNALAKVSAVVIFKLVFMKQNLKHCNVVIDSIDADGARFQDDEDAVDVAAVAQEHDLPGPRWRVNRGYDKWVLTVR